MNTINKDSLNKNLWLLDDDPQEGFIPVHHHSNDSRKDFLVDAKNSEVVSEKDASEKTLRKISRRGFNLGAVALAATFLAPSIEPRYAFAADTTGTNDNILIVVFARGAMDGLNVLGPYNDPVYTQKRKTAFVTPANGDYTLNST